MGEQGRRRFSGFDRESRESGRRHAQRRLMRPALPVATAVAKVAKEKSKWEKANVVKHVAALSSSGKQTWSHDATLDRLLHHLCDATDGTFANAAAVLRDHLRREKKKRMSNLKLKVGETSWEARQGGRDGSVRDGALGCRERRHTL